MNEDRRYYWMELSETSAALMGPDQYDLVALVWLEGEKNEDPNLQGPWRCAGNCSRLNFRTDHGDLAAVKRLATSEYMIDLEIRASEETENLCAISDLLMREYGEVEKKCGIKPVWPAE